MTGKPVQPPVSLGIHILRFQLGLTRYMLLFGFLMLPVAIVGAVFFTGEYIAIAFVAFWLLLLTGLRWLVKAALAKRERAAGRPAGMER